MGLFSFLSGLSGQRTASAVPETAQPLRDDEIEVTAELNHKIGPIDRGDRYEDPLDEALKKHGYGEVDGGGTLLSEKAEIQHCDVNLILTSPAISIPYVIQFLESRGAPKGSKLRIYEGVTERVVPFGVREGFAIYLDGVNLPKEVYQTSDSNFVVSEINRQIAGHGEIEGHWQGPAETALYIYGDSIEIMKPLVAEFVASYPLCQGARVVNLTP